MKRYPPYSLYRYGQVDGRIKFQYKPRHKSNQLLVNIKQMDILFNPKTDCYLILLSFELNCRLSFDARYFFPPYEDMIQEGRPIVFYLSQGIVEVDYLDPDQFKA